MASAPELAAKRASSASKMPLIMSLPPHSFLIHSTSPQFKPGSNCSAVHEDREDILPTPVACPTMLRKVLRGVIAIPRHQRGLVAILIIFAMVSFGGADRPFLRSLLR